MNLRAFYAAMFSIIALPVSLNAHGPSNMPHRGSADAAREPIRAVLEKRHGKAEEDPNAHRKAHGSLDGLSMKDLEAAANPKAGLNFRQLAQAQSGAVSGTPDQIGQWTGIINMPVVPIFATLLPNGKVLMWDSVGDNPAESYSLHNFTRAAVLDVNTLSTTRVDVSGYNIFCAGFAHMLDGNIFVAGGNADSALNGIKQTHIYNWNTNTWSRGPDMAYSRWYPSVAALANGEHFVMAGGPSTHEVRQLNNTMRTLTGATLQHARDYPFIQTGLDGRVIYAGPDAQMRLIDTSGTGSITQAPLRDGLYRGYGSYAMYNTGKVLVMGGAGSTNSATIITQSGNSLSTAAADSMRYGRRQHNATVLADGSVLVTGGLSSGAGLVDLDAAVYAAEVWDPATGLWRELASAAVARQYHSVALLLPDGRVLTGGGGICGDCQRVGYLRKDIEIFSPPYLFRKDGSGQLAARPAITAAPATVNYGNRFEIATAQATGIMKASLVRLGAPTHSQDQDQRYIPLDFTVGAGVLNATAPANANIAPPGYYMLFIVDSNGVPSVAKIVQVNTETPPPPPPPPAGTGAGLLGQYFNNMTLSSIAALQRTEAINFDWGTGAPAAGIAADRFSARWSGQVEAPISGNYVFQTVSDDGIRVTLAGVQIINNWTDHAPTTNNSGVIPLVAGTKYPITVEFYENGGGAVVKLLWQTPGEATFAPVPADRLYAASSPPPPPAGGTFASTLVAKHSGRCMAVPGASRSSGVQLVQNTCTGSTAQHFDFLPVAGALDTYTIKNRNSGLCLDVANASLQNGTAVTQRACANTQNQRFALSPVPAAGAKAFLVKPLHSGQCTDVYGGSTASGAKIIQWPCHGGANQTWNVSGRP